MYSQFNDQMSLAISSSSFFFSKEVLSPLHLVLHQPDLWTSRSQGLMMYQILIPYKLYAIYDVAFIFYHDLTTMR